MILHPYQNALEPGRFVRRYKRFFVDVERTCGQIETVHCANTGSLRSCLSEGGAIYTLRSDKPGRKLASGLELAKLEDGLACLNTARANHLVERWLADPECAVSVEGGDLLTHDLPELRGGILKREARSPLDASSRFDLRISGEFAAHWVELKTVTLRIDQQTLAWPDAVTERGAKHVRELARLAKEVPGGRGHLWFVIMRGSALPAVELASRFRAAHEFDSEYAKLLNEAYSDGLSVRIVVASVDFEGLGVRGYFPWIKT